MSEKVIIKSGFWFAVCNVIQKSVPLLMVPIFTRLMTMEEYGTTAVYQSWNNVLSIVITLNLHAGIFNNGMLRYKNDRDRYIAALQGLSTISALTFILLFFAFRKQLTIVLGLPVCVELLMFISYIFLPAFEYWSARNRYEYRYKGLLAATIAYAVVNFTIPVVAVVCSEENLGEIKILASLIAMICFSSIFYVYNFFKGKCFFLKKYWVYAFLFNLPLLPNYLANMILNQSDRIMISRLCGESYAGVYSIACYFQTGVSVIISAINATFVPWLYEKLENKEYDRIQKRVEPILALLGYLTFVVISCAPELIRFMAPRKYYGAIWAVPPVVLGTYFTVLYMLCANVEIYYAKRVFMSCATVIAALLNVILNYMLIPKFGYIACAYTTVFCYFVYGASHYFFMGQIKTVDGRLSNFHIYNMKRNAVIYGIVILLSAVQMALYSGMFPRYFLVTSATAYIFIQGRKYHYAK